MTAISGDIPIDNDEINEGAEEFVVVLEVASNTTNPVDLTGQTQTTVCRIPASDRKYHLKCSTKCHAWPDCVSCSHYHNTVSVFRSVSSGLV